MSILMRAVFLLATYILFLGIISIDVKYTDGLHIKLVGWPDILTDLYKKRKETKSEKKHI